MLPRRALCCGQPAYLPPTRAASSCSRVSPSPPPRSGGCCPVIAMYSSISASCRSPCAVMPSSLQRDAELLQHVVEAAQVSFQVAVGLAEVGVRSPTATCCACSMAASRRGVFSGTKRGRPLLAPCLHPHVLVAPAAPRLSQAGGVEGHDALVRPEASPIPCGAARRRGSAAAMRPRRGRRRRPGRSARRCPRPGPTSSCRARPASWRWYSASSSP